MVFSRYPVAFALMASLLAILFATSVNLSVKYAAEENTPQHIILFFRYVGGMLIILPVLFINGARSYRSKKPLIQGVRTVMITVALALYFWTISVLPVGVASALHNLSPLFIPLGGWLLLNEKLSLKLFVPVFVGLCGATLATQATLPTGGYLVLCLAVLSAAFGGFSAPLGKYLVRYDSLLTLVTWPAIGGIIFATIWCILSGFMLPSASVVFFLSITGALGYAGWFLAQWAYEHLTSGAVAPMRYLGIPINLLAGLFFFGEVLGLNALLGVSLIFIGCLLPWLEFKGLRERLKKLQRFMTLK